MHGVILAGGEGRRLAADGVPEPKALMRIGGRPQLERLVEILEALGSHTLTAMVHEDVDVASFGVAAGRRILRCRTPSSLHTLVLGLAAIPPGPVFCTMVDTVMAWTSWTRAWTACAGALAQGAPAVLVVTPPSTKDPHPLCVRTDAAGHVTGFDDDARTAEWVTAGVYGFGPVARGRAANALAEGVERMRGFLALLVREGGLLPLVTVDRALDVDRRRDLDVANAWAALGVGAPPGGGRS